MFVATLTPVCFLSNSSPKLLDKRLGNCFSGSMSCIESLRSEFEEIEDMLEDGETGSFLFSNVLGEVGDSKGDSTSSRAEGSVSLSAMPSVCTKGRAIAIAA